MSFSQSLPPSFTSLKPIMKYKVTSADGKEVKVDCIGCAINNGKINTIGGLIDDTKHFGIEQDYEIPIPGFFIIGSKRHFRSFEEMTKEESIDLINFIIRIRKAMKSIGIKEITVVQEEKSENSHFHIWLFPWWPWMEEKVGKGLNSIRIIMEYARKNMKEEENLNEVKKYIKLLKISLKN